MARKIAKPYILRPSPPELIKPLERATLLIIYNRGDYKGLVNEFVLVDDDRPPYWPRFTRFVRFWRLNINAKIRYSEFSAASLEAEGIRHVDFMSQFN